MRELRGTGKGRDGGRAWRAITMGTNTTRWHGSAALLPARTRAWPPPPPTRHHLDAPRYRRDGRFEMSRFRTLDSPAFARTDMDMITAVASRRPDTLSLNHTRETDRDDRWRRPTQARQLHIARMHAPVELGHRDRTRARSPSWLCVKPRLGTARFTGSNAASGRGRFIPRGGVA